MKFSATYHFPASREKVFALITDPAVLQRCIEGCQEMVRTSEDNYDAHLKIGVAGLKGNYVGKVQLKDKHLPESYTLLIDGKGSPGFVKANAKITLADKGGETELKCDADAQVGGMIASIGSRLVEAIAKKLTEGFFKKLAGEVNAHQTPAAGIGQP
jgi:carbon monoxide dehydrogenase subunit G